MEVAKRYQDNLERIKTTIRRAHDGFKPNYDRYNEYKRFVFDTSLDSAEITLLMTLSRPQIEFNVLEAYVSRLLGEFSKQEPDIEVSSDDHTKTDPIMLKVVEEHLRHVLTDSKNHHTRYEVYKDLLAGGFSVLKVYTDYDNPMSMKQEICIERVFDPTLCGFDLLSKYSHKGDGRFCFELYPKSKEDFEEEFPDVKIDALSFRRDMAGFNWSYLNDTGKMLIVCDYYEKKKKETKIVQLVDGSVKKWDDYKKMLDEWKDLAAPPAIVGKPRKTTIEQICRYRLIENQVLEYVETDFNHLPLIFVDGNSVMIKTPKNSNVRQVTRPYVYHAKGAQRLKNFAGIALANEIENTVQHKFMVAKEALPKEEDFLQAYKDVQKASVLVYNANHENNPDLPIANPIREIHRDPAPPEMVQAFNGSDSLIQNILGSYDASLGINNNQLSGIAIVEAASQSNSAAMPYIVGFLQGLQRAAQIYVDLMPKYYTTPRTIPIVDNDGMRNYVKINQPDGIDMESFDTNALNVVVKAGASFQVQKARTINMIKEIMGMSPLFQQFIAEKGINFVLDNMEGKGVDQLKSMVEEWVKELEQQKAMAQQMQQQEMQNNPAMMKVQNDRAKLQLEGQKMQSQMAIDMAKLQTDQQKILADVQLAKESNLVQVLKANTERFAKQVDYSLKHKDMGHRHLREAIETHHKVNQHKHGGVNG
jgi:Skp family chaperone for outer membrane proteins